MADIPAFTSFAPGFEFLQGLVKNAGAALPGIGQWVAPTLNPEELDKRIQELRTIQFWLEQNARMLGATIQALEVQKMTLATLQTMNVQMSDLRDSLTIRMPATAAAHGATGAAPPSDATDESEEEHTPALAEAAATTEAASTAEAGADTARNADPKPAVDPMQWWGALTQQFSELAANALKEGAAGLAAVPGAAPTQASHAPHASRSNTSASSAPPRQTTTTKTSVARSSRAASAATRKTPARTKR
ncbi:MAG: PhaM family polyhydroxyalkanoate granule multifunctional regulatory protein [Rhizobacter sp.]